MTQFLWLNSVYNPHATIFGRYERKLSPAHRPAEVEPEPGDDVAAEIAALGETEAEEAALAVPVPLVLPFARRDRDRLRLVLLAQRRLREVHRSPGVKHMLAGRAYFEEALRWLEIQGGAEGQQLAAHWRSLDLGDVPAPASGEGQPPAAAPENAEPRTGRRRRRRRRRRPRSSPEAPP